jgi:hypothetical protein
VGVGRGDVCVGVVADGVGVGVDVGHFVVANGC